MAENSKIEWTHHTFNAWYGCQKVGPPCDFCYAEVWAKRSGLVEWGPHGARRRSSPEQWKKPRKWDAEAKAAGERRRVFSLSLGDWLDNQAPREWRYALWGEIEATPNLDWLLLTKRIQNYAKLVPWHANRIPPNVWLGITCGDQAEYDRDWPILREIKARVRFISHEPSLGPLALPTACKTFAYDPVADEILPDWIICGGESGSHARMMDPQWARDLRDDCARLGIAYFFKQMTGKKPIPDDLMVRQFPATTGRPT